MIDRYGVIVTLEFDETHALEEMFLKQRKSNQSKQLNLVLFYLVFDIPWSVWINVWNEWVWLGFTDLGFFIHFLIS